MALTSLHGGISPTRGGWDGEANRLHSPEAGCDPLAAFAALIPAATANSLYCNPSWREFAFL